VRLIEYCEKENAGFIVMERVREVREEDEKNVSCMCVKKQWQNRGK
jgi:hypothetical protein